MTNVKEHVPTKLVTPTRLRQILECYGGSPTSWPAAERQAALNLLQGSAELRALQDEALFLDKSLNTLLEETQELEHGTLDQHAVQRLQQRIMSQLPKQESPASDSSIYISSIHNSSLHNSSTHSGHQHNFWWGSIAASVFVVSLSLGVIYELNGPGHAPITGQTNIAQTSESMDNDEFTQWAWEDITGESPADDSNNDPTTLLALVELELPVE